MRIPQMLRSLCGLATLFWLLTLAIMRPPVLAEWPVGSKWQCDTSWFMSAFRILAWILSEQGLGIITAAIAATGVILLLWRHPLPEANELAITIILLLAFLSFVALRNQASIDTQKCRQPEAHLAGTSHAGTPYTANTAGFSPVRLWPVRLAMLIMLSRLPAFIPKPPSTRTGAPARPAQRPRRRAL